MKAIQVIGIILILISLPLFFVDVIRITMILLIGLAVLNIVSPFLSGKKIAGYLHDSKLAKEKGFKANPMSFVYIWLFIWIVFMLIYISFTMIFSYSIKYIISTFKADYLGIVYTVIMLIGSYAFFRGRYEEVSTFLTRWGKSLEKAKKIGISQAKKMADKAKTFEKYL